MIHIKTNLDCRENVSFILNDERNPYSHIHSQQEFLYVLRGTATVITAERTYHLQPEEFMVFPAFELHTVTGDETLQTLSLYIAPRIPEILQQPAPTGRIACLSTRRPADTPLYNAIRQRLANLFYHYTLSDITERALFWGDCFQLLDLCSQVEEEAPAGGDVPAEGRHHIARVVQYMSAHYTEPLTLQGMAQREFISPGHLSKLFKTILGCTFLQYFNMLRLAHALTDLMQPANTITDIAMNHGFRSTNRFIHLFREQFGQTPGQYRQTLKNQPREAFSPESRTTLFNPLLRKSRPPEALRNGSVPGFLYRPRNSADADMAPHFKHWHRERRPACPGAGADPPRTARIGLYTYPAVRNSGRQYPDPAFSRRQSL